MDTTFDNAFYIHLPDEILRFKHNKKLGVYYFDTKCNKEVINLTTVKEQREKYSALDNQRADVARKIQQAMGFILRKDLLKASNNNLIRDCVTTRRDIQIADNIFGPDQPSIKGKTKQREVKHVREDNIQELLEHIQKEYGNNVTLEIDIMYVNSILFLITTSQHLRIVTAHRLKNRHANTIVDALDITLGLYRIRGLDVKQIFADGKFERVRKQLLEPSRKISLNTTTKDEHCPSVEREIQTIKERC